VFKFWGSYQLGGIRPVSGKFIRPLINTYRKDIIYFLQKNNISFCVDRKNLENIYFRNKIRNMLIPFIEENFSKSFKNNVSRATDILREEDIFLEDSSEKIFSEIAVIEKDKKSESIFLVKISLDRLVKIPIALSRRVILGVVEKLKGNLKDINYKNIEDILSLCRGKTGKKTIYVF
jgi:tRNA(Ile)-lysidine synthase